MITVILSLHPKPTGCLHSMSPKFVDTARERIRHWLWIAAIVWLLVSGAVVVYYWLGEGDGPSPILGIYFHATLVSSLVGFLLFGWDKRQAKREGWRISENTLHWMAILGGWPGTVLGQQTFHHKTVKSSFRLTSGLILFVHLLIILWGSWNLFKSWILGT